MIELKEKPKYMGLLSGRKSITGDFTYSQAWRKLQSPSRIIYGFSDEPLWKEVDDYWLVKTKSTPEGWQVRLVKRLTPDNIRQIILSERAEAAKAEEERRKRQEEREARMRLSKLLSELHVPQNTFVDTEWILGSLASFPQSEYDKLTMVVSCGSHQATLTPGIKKKDMRTVLGAIKATPAGRS